MTLTTVSLPQAPAGARPPAARPRRTPTEPLPLCRYRPRAGHPDLARLHAEALAIADEVRPRLVPPPGGLIEARRRARSYATFAANYVENRRRARQGREDFLPLYFIWTLLRACNFTCTYCDDHRGRKYPELPDEGRLDTAQGLELLRVMRTGSPSVYFAGGEPTMRRDLPELTHAAFERGYFPIILNTNGSAIDRLLRLESHRAWLGETDVIVVSLDALDLAHLAKLYAYRRPEDVIRNLLVLRELAEDHRVKLMVNTVIQPGRIGDARDVLDLVNDLGIWFCPVPMNAGPRIARGLGDDPEFRAFARLVLERKRQGCRITGSARLNGRLLASAPLDCRNTLKPHVDHDGHLFWPCKASVNVEPERIRVLDYPDVRSLWAAASARVDPTRFHGPARNQCGADCNWAQNYTTDAYAHGLARPLSLVSEVLELVQARA
ncbi:MAG: radical SAM protein [Polyangiaceae bacterium]|nr:radical SAM protein [Polyangiaceae bacterium]